MRGMPRVIWVLGLASLLNDVSSEAIFPLLPLFLTQLGAPMGFIGLIEGSADALGSILKVVAGRLSDRGPRKLFVVGGYTIPALARAAISAALAPWHVFAARLLDRTGKGIRSGPRDAMIAESVPPSQRGRAFGVNRSMDHFGAALGPLLASALLWAGLNLRMVFLIAAAIGMMAPIVLFFRLREQPVDVADHSGPVDAPARGSLRRGYSSYLVACVLFALGNSSDAFLLMRAHEVGWSAKALPLLWAFHHLVKSLAAVPGGALSDRHSRGGGGVVRLGGLRAHVHRVRFCVAALADPGAVPRVRALPRPRRGGGARDRRGPVRSRRARARLRPLSRAGRGGGAAGRLGTGLVWDKWGPAWALGANAAFAAVASAFLFALTFAGPLRRAQATAQ